MKLQILILALAAIFGMASGLCEFMGEEYRIGTTIMQSGCRQIICCTDGNTYFWVAVEAPTDECNECCVFMDPRIRTFDRSDHYSWPGTCRYSLVEYMLESVDEETPKFAVYGDFKKCGWSSTSDPSCIDISSYQLSNDINDVIHVKHPHIFEVFNAILDYSHSFFCDNAKPTPIVLGSQYRAFCWRENNCMNILGPNLLVTFCEHQVCVTASEEYMGFFGGLCGKYNGIAKDDHTDKNGFTYPWNDNVPDFAASWQVNPYFYVDEDCEGFKRMKRDAFNEEKDCADEEMMTYMELCMQRLQGFTESEDLFNDIQMACAEDLCAFPEDREKWLQIALQCGQEQNALLFPSNVG